MFCSLLSITLFVTTVFPSELEWTYDDQEAWPDLTDSKCGDSSGQSPINIDTSNTEDCLSDDEEFDWAVNYNELTFTISNSESHHGIKIVPTNTGDKYNIGELKNLFVTSTEEHQSYCLDSFHIHWGSEHTIDNVRSELEVHFVHFSCDYDSVSEAFAASPTDPYTLAVVGVLFEIGAENAFLKEITDEISSLESAGSSITVTASQQVSISDLFNNELGESFYHYKGSLTTPTCDPIVSWHVIENKMTLTVAQEQAFRTILDTDNSVVLSNYRDVQTAPTVYLCEED